MVRLPSLLSIALLSLSAQPVLAQPAQPDQQRSTAPTIDEIVVLGQKRPTRIFDVEESVFIAGPEILERQPVIDLYDVVERVPNITQAIGGRGFVIRGIDQRGAASSGSNNLALSVYVDDSPLNNRQTFAGPLDVWDLEQVEVYRGPQSTNFGRNTLAGAIYTRTRDPGFDWEARGRALIAEQDTYQIAGAIGGPLIAEKAAFRIAASRRESDGFITNTFLDEPADPRELTSLRGKILLTPTDRIEAVLTSYYFESFRGDDNVVALGAALYDREVVYNTPRNEGADGVVHSGRITFDLSDRLQLLSITTYNQSDYVRTEDFDGTPLPIAELDRSGEDTAVSQELRLNLTTDRVQLTLGGYYYSGDDTFIDEFVTPVTVINPALPSDILVSRVSDTGRNVTNYAAFADLTYALTDRLNLLAGLRYDTEESDFAANSVTQFVTPIPPELEFLRAFEGSNSSFVDAEYDAWLPKLGLQYYFDPDLVASFVISHAYRAGGSQLNTVTGAPSTFDPEFLTNYEASLKGRSLDGDLFWAASAYYGDWTDQQLSEPAAPNVTDIFITVNAGKSEIWGLELEGDYQIAEAWSVRAAVGYSHTEFVDYDVFDTTTGEFVSVAGNRFVYAPEWTGSLGLDYGLAQGPFASATLNYTGGSFGDVENRAETEVDGRVVADLQAGWRFERWGLTGFVTNAFDEQYLYNKNERFIVGRPGPPRVFGVRLDASF